MITASVGEKDVISASTQLLLLIEKTAWTLISSSITDDVVIITGLMLVLPEISFSVHPLKEKPSGAVVSGSSPISSPFGTDMVSNKLPLS